MNETKPSWPLHGIEDDTQMEAGDRGSDPLGPAPESEPGPLGKEGSASMDDKDVRRLEDRIDAAEERGRLRLETAMARTDGKLDWRRSGRPVHAGSGPPAADDPPAATASTTGATGRAGSHSAAQLDW